MGSSTGFCFLSLLRICTMGVQALHEPRAEVCCQASPEGVSAGGVRGARDGLVWVFFFFLIHGKSSFMVVIQHWVKSQVSARDYVMLEHQD